jgi:hypothetical protein
VTTVVKPLGQDSLHRVCNDREPNQDAACEVGTHISRRSALKAAVAVSVLAAVGRSGVAVGNSHVPRRAKAPDGIRGLDGAAIHEMLKNGETTSVKLVRAHCDRIKAYDTPYRNEPGLRASEHWSTLSGCRRVQALARDCMRECTPAFVGGVALAPIVNENVGAMPHALDCDRVANAPREQPVTMTTLSLSSIGGSNSSTCQRRVDR